MSKIKICHVIGNFVNGGVEAVIYNYFSHIDMEKYEVHIIGHGIRVQECADRFVSLGFKIHNITPKSVSFIRSCKEMEAIFRNEQFDIVHSHLTEWACVPMFLAWKCGVKIRINHSHMAEKPQGMKNKIYYGVRLYFGKLFATDYFACGRDAGIYLFGNHAVDSGKVTILPNAVDYEKFSYNIQLRNEIREKYNIKDSTIVVGHVGRFFEQKNHEFLIDIFEEYHKENLDSILVMLGDGELINKIKDKVTQKKLEGSVCFLGNQSNVAEWYQAMDMFLLTSYYEGFPVVGVEAQVSGLPCLFSDGITPEIQISPNAQFMSLESGSKAWVEKMKYMIANKQNRGNLILNHDRFDIEKNADKLDLFYQMKVKEVRATA